jgi:adenylate cyclase
VLWDAIGAIFRRHLVLVSYQRWSTDEEGVAVIVERAVGFVDLVGSTDVLRTVSVSETAALVNRFEQLVWDSATSAGGRVVKLIGDEAMFVADDAAAACRLASETVERSVDAVRVGLAYGPAVALHGDYYGPTVNLAARLVAVASPGSVVVSDVVRNAAGDEFRFEPFEVGSLRGFPDVTSAFRLAAPDSLPSSR